MSVQRACRVLDVCRRRLGYVPRRCDDEGPLVKTMLDLVRAHPRFGCRRIWALLRASGWAVNRKRVHRLWKQNGFGLLPESVAIGYEIF